MRVGNTIFHFAGQEKAAQENKTVKSAITKLAEQPIKVSISKEGYESYHNSVTESRQALSYDGAIRQKKNLMDADQSKGMDYSYRLSKEANQLNESDTEALTDGKSLSWQAKAENYAEAYAKLYDEIVQGYENGTRQINVIDENSELGYHTLTMEEELNGLDAAYEKNVKGFEEYATQQKKAQTIIGEWKEQVAKIKSGVTSAQSVENQTEKDSGQDKLPENLAEKLLSVRDSWKATYAASGKNEAWKSIISMFSTMFQ